MVLSQFARIGNGPLTRAVGIQKNFKEVITVDTPKLDVEASGCFSCDNYHNIQFFEFLPKQIQDETQNRCANCKNAVYCKRYKVRYINEANRYGIQPRLKSNAIKLLLVYHFCNPDGNGLVRNVDIKDLANLIGCTTRTIKN